MKIYTFPRSRSLRVLWTLEELGVDYETVRVDMFSDKPKVKSPHSRGKVPLMVDGDVSIEETFAICHYLCNKHPKETFYPSDIKEQSVIYSYISFALTDLESPIWNLLKQLVFIPEEKRSLSLVDYFKIESENVTRQFKLNKDNEWVAGDNFTLADIFLSHTLLWARLCHVNLSPTINDYIDRAISRRSYIQAQEKNNL
ncbi:MULTISPECIES: glutathione S-transferase family protein [Providencia]|nr:MULTISPECIES: glutathione S-transferase family protein [Providencia]EJD6081102.1 glutathione S-transferase family protein [Providencia rettgeri]EJD6601987.1 glutathione S-transferase family protein [Providencia rettgeri]ELR5148499.1 glutathione S-transferase family protein [Providencia rettgeri]ELR5225328.1 glutathione S-transferase family protein [Providencia rettgeri]ELR5251401.1 glutathione S-transferase family protein [Providencia rettgeri]